MHAFPLLRTPIEAPFFLPDGRPLQFGPITPAAKPLIERAMARLSPETSRRRFFTVRYKLSERGAGRHDAARRRQPIRGGRVDRAPRRGRRRRRRRALRARRRPTARRGPRDAGGGRVPGTRRRPHAARPARERGNRARHRRASAGWCSPTTLPMLRLLREFAPDLGMRRVDDYYDVEVPLAEPELTTELRGYAAGPLSSMTLPSGSVM